MAYPYDAGDLAAITRCASYYNGNDYNASTNPGGMANGGHRTNFIPSLQDVARIASAVSSAAGSASSSASAASASAASAAGSVAALTGTSTTSVAIGTGAKTLTTQSGKSLDVGSFVLVTSDANPTTHYMAGQVTSYSGTSLTINVSVSSGSGSRSDWTILGRSGTPGATGSTGATGPQGETPALQWTFGNGTSDSDPGNGVLLINNAVYNAATYLYIDNLDRNGATATTFLDSLDDSTNTGNRGTLFLTQIGASTKYAMFSVTGAVVDGSGYRKVPVSHIMSNGTFDNGASLAMSFVRSGDKGADGGGAGDTISDISSVTDGRVVIFNGTSGKHITNAPYGIGTSGSNIAALSTGNTWGGAQTFAAGVDIQQALTLSGDITPTQITSNQDNYAPTGNATASVMRLSTDASRNITGIANGADGRVLMLINVGSFDIVLINDATSTAGNRFLIGADYILASGQAITLIYDATATRWRPISLTGLGSSGNASRPMWSFAGDPNTGMYNAEADVLGFAAGGTGYARLSANAFCPVTNDGTALGTGSLMWSDLVLASGGVINWNNGNYTLTHSSGALSANGTFGVSLSAGSQAGLSVTVAANASSQARLSLVTGSNAWVIYGDNSGNLKFNNSSDWVSFTSTGVMTLAATTASSSTTTGALVVGGGGGFGNAVHANGVFTHCIAGAIAQGFQISETVNGRGRALYVTNTSDDAMGFYGLTGSHNIASLDASGAWINASDRRWKDKIEGLRYGVEDLMRLRPRQFVMRSNGRPGIGFIAQEVAPVIPELISGIVSPEDGETYYNMNYGGLTPLLTSVAQNHEERLRALEGSH